MVKIQIERAFDILKEIHFQPGDTIMLAIDFDGTKLSNPVTIALIIPGRPPQHDVIMRSEEYD